MMNDFIDVSSKELIVRKRVVNFIEKIFKYFGYDFYHDDLKMVLYSELPARTNLELKAKSYYDAYMYLLENRKSAITAKLLSKFFYLAIAKIIDDEKLRKISLNYYLYNNINIIDKALCFQNEIYNLLINEANETRILISLMFFNYELVRNNIPSIQFRLEFLKEYEILMRSSNQNNLYFLFKECLEHSKFQDKTYYQSLFKLTQYDVVNKLKELKNTLIDVYFVNELYIFGSFAKGLERIDSDLDLLVKYSLDINVHEKNNISKELKNLLMDSFKRFVDLKEITVEINDEFIIKNSLIIKII